MKGEKYIYFFGLNAKHGCKIKLQSNLFLDIILTNLLHVMDDFLNFSVLIFIEYLINYEIYSVV
jgi:hypothetical protein